MIITCETKKKEQLTIEVNVENFIFGHNRGLSHLMVYDDKTNGLFMACDESYNIPGNWIVPFTPIEGHFGFGHGKPLQSNMPLTNTLKGKICIKCLKKNKYIKIITRSGGVSNETIKNEKIKTKLDRLATPGYYVEYLLDDKGGFCNLNPRSLCTNSTKWGVTYIGKDARCCHVHTLHGGSWYTTSWSAAPTKKQVEKASKEQKARRGQASVQKYEYYATWEELVNNCKIPIHDIVKQERAPFDV